MVQVRRTGLPNPKAAFDELRPLRERLIKMGSRTKSEHRRAVSQSPAPKKWEAPKRKDAGAG